MAKELSLQLQQNSNMASIPDPTTAAVINKWLETHIPVSYTYMYILPVISWTIYALSKAHLHTQKKNNNVDNCIICTVVTWL